MSKPTEKVNERRRFSQAPHNTANKDRFFHSQSPKMRPRSPSPYLQEMRKVEVQKIVSQTKLTRF